ncbi:heme biosynthesis HemY N-terminal domain-containing protein [Ideonella sp.]|uniref:heme biosynthesis HemY N-terminal domain-containing protein n=1 Tax=Ideonella sp. TaxID=1929293 RepID=UPI002B4856D0|nr:heme biosynthesis HemY N-terminal domain-containing protein [Ideonella sp.]HJV68644.1 heme biosynthesis HemY N-terminal domain-containing protein [Ideonella sp.]
MRSVIWLVLLFTAAVVAATVLGRNDALVSVFYDSWRLDLSLNLFLLALLATIFIVFAALQAAQSLLSLPTRAREWREQKRERAAGAALREALAELFAARYARAQRAAQRALDLQALSAELRADTQFTVLAEMVAASGLHRLQDKRGRDERMNTALALVRGRAGSATAFDGLQLLGAEWALEDRDAERGLALLAELPPGAARRTQALRLKLQAARQERRPLDALQTARLLAKHQGFSAPAAQSLLRSLAIEAIEQAYDLDQLRRVWAHLDADDRRDAFVVARAARRAQAMGHAEQGRLWLQAAWDAIATAPAEDRRELALALVACAPGVGNDWLPRIEAALSAHGHEPALVAAAGMAFADRQLWGKARRPLEQTASAASLPAPVRRQALRCLAAIAREEGHEEQAQAYDQRAAAID